MTRFYTKVLGMSSSLFLMFPLFILFCFYKTVFLCVTALAILLKIPISGLQLRRPHSCAPCTLNLPKEGQDSPPSLDPSP